MTVLSVVRDTMARLSLTQPTVVFTSTDLQVQQLKALLMEAAEDLMDYGDGAGWQSMQREHTFITVAQEAQTNTPIPPDLGSFINGTFYDRTNQRQLFGPLTPQQYQAQKARPVLVQPFLAFREREGDFLISPAPAAGETIAYEYVSNYYARSTAGVAKREFTADDDTTFLDEELLKKSLRWRWKQAKGLDYGEDMTSYERAVARAYGADAAAATLIIGGPSTTMYPEAFQVPEGSWGVG
jgi:hypothetical protein